MNFEVKVVQQARVKGEGPLLFTVVRDEEFLLPHFLRHYRQLGFSRFVVFDDQSTDGTRDLLHAQDDCTVLKSQARFAEPAGTKPNGRPIRFVNVLRQRVPEQMAPGGWSLVVDADEFLILPPAYATIGQLVRHLDDTGQYGLTTAMVEFYPERLNDRNYSAAMDPFEGCRYFDQGPYYKWDGKREPTLFPRGIRARLTLMLQKARPDVTLALFNGPAKVPSLNKVPLLKDGQGLKRGTGAHELTTPPPAGISAALAHFKFGPDLDARVAHALASSAYEDGSIGYRVIKALIEEFGDTPLVDSQSRLYTGPQSIVDAQLMEPIRHAAN